MKNEEIRVDPQVTMAKVVSKKERSQTFKKNLMKGNDFHFLSLAFPQWPQLLLPQFINPPYFHVEHPFGILVSDFIYLFIVLCPEHESL